jgi:hypothetical protein
VEFDFLFLILLGMIQPIIDEQIAIDILNHISSESEVNTIWIKAIKYISRY